MKIYPFIIYALILQIINIGFIFMLNAVPAKIAIIDFNQIKSAFVAHMIMQKLDDKNLQISTEKFSRNLEIIATQIAKEKNIIILPKQAVFAGATDITAEVKSILEKKYERNF